MKKEVKPARRKIAKKPSVVSASRSITVKAAPVKRTKKILEKPQPKLGKTGLFGDSVDHSVHDKVIQNLIGWHFQLGMRERYGNPGSQKKHEIKGLYPDVLVKDGKDWWILEVKTKSEVSAKMVTQLRKYKDVADKVWLVVPKDKLEEAKRICVRYGLRMRFGHWYQNLIGGMQVDFEEM